MIKQLELLSRPHTERDLANAIKQHGRIDVSAALNRGGIRRSLGIDHAIDNTDLIVSLEMRLIEIDQAEAEYLRLRAEGYGVDASYPLVGDLGVTLILSKLDTAEPTPAEGSVSLSLFEDSESHTRRFDLRLEGAVSADDKQFMGQLMADLVRETSALPITHNYNLAIDWGDGQGNQTEEVPDD